MRKSLALLALAAVGVLATAGDASAQRRGNGGGRGYYNGGGSYYGSGYNSNRYGYGNNWYGNNWAGNNWAGNLAGNYLYGNNAYNSGYYTQPYYSGYSQPYYNSQPYSTTGGYVQGNVIPSTTTSGYYVPQQAIVPNSGVAQTGYSTVDTSSIAMVKVITPTSDAKLWINGELMDVTGRERAFRSPTLDAGKNYTYTMKAQWTDGNGKTEEKTRDIQVTPGANLVLDFNSLR